MKIIFFLLIFSLIQISKQTCSEGCLACGANSRCLLCDFKNGYAFNEMNCVKSQIKNCLTINISGNCLACQSGYYLDTMQTKCLNVPTANLQTNCITYSDRTKCQECKESYPINGVCGTRQSISQIENCMYYTGPLQCSKCKDGYLLSFQKNKCLKTSQTNNCLQFTNIKCNECQTGFFYDKNYIQNQIKIQFYNYGIIENFVRNQDSDFQIQNLMTPFFNEKTEFQNSCLQHVVNNCVSFRNFSVCDECANGYYLKDNKCFVAPKEVIQNCRIYSNETTCDQCNQGYYFKVANECHPVTPIEHCQIYNPSSSVVQCQECNRNHVLNTVDNSCEVRKNLNNQCETYNTTKDECEKCMNDTSTYILTDDKLTCLQSLPNCIKYNTSNKNDTQLVCNQCAELFFLNNANQCVLGTVPLCRVYFQLENKCQECQNGYYVYRDNQGSEFCRKHTEVKDCDQYNNQDNDRCEKCEQGFMMMVQKSQCLPQNIDGCDQYSAINTCSLCKDGYDKVTDNFCEKLDQDSFCLRAVSGQCVKCRDTHIFVSGKCIPPLEYQTLQCVKTAIIGQTSNYTSGICDVCQKNSIPFNMKGKILCVKDSEVIDHYQNNFLLAFCEVFYKDGTQVKCKQCQEGYYLGVDGSGNQECKFNCDGGKLAVPGHFQFNSTDGLVYSKEKDCVTKPSAGGEYDNYTFLGQKYQTYTTYKAVSYKDNFFLKNDYTTPSSTSFVLVPKENITFGQPVSQFIYQFPEISDSYPKADVEKIIEDCEIYSPLNNHEVNCTKCKFGYFGLIEDWQAKYCHLYDATKCEKCIHTYYPDLSRDSLFCIEHNIPGCERFSNTDNKCLMCKEKFWLSSDRLTCNKYTHIDNCLHYHKFEAKCVLCKALFHYNSTQTRCEKKIKHCIEYDNTQNPIQCLLCEPNYIRNTSNNTCDLNLREECYFTPLGNDTDTANNCLIYNNVLKVKYTNKCALANTVKNCGIYQDKDNCKHCEQDYYLVEGICCQHHRHPATADTKLTGCTQTNTENCYEYYLDTNENPQKYKCKTCIETHHLTNEKCCQKGYYYNTTGNTCVNVLKYDNTNTKKCQIFDIYQESCSACTIIGSDQYYVSKGLCCKHGEYYNSGQSSCRVITELDALVVNCLELDDNESLFCKKCKTGFGLSNKCCSPTAEFLNAGGVCQSKANYCDEYTGSICSKCKTGFYHGMSNDVCCTEVNQYYSGTQCQTVTNTIPSCAQYDENQKCIGCVSGKYLTVVNKCCSESEVYDGKGCVAMTTYFDNCQEIEKDSFKTKSFIINDNIWWDFACSECKNTFTYNALTGTCTTFTAITGCDIHYFNTSGDLRCHQCATGKHTENSEQNCCDDGKVYFTHPTSGVGCWNIDYEIKDCYVFDTATKQCATLVGASTFINTLSSSNGCSRSALSDFFINTKGKCCSKSTGDICDIDNNADCSVLDGANCLLCDDNFQNIYTAATCVAVTNSIVPTIKTCEYCKATHFTNTTEAATCCNEAVATPPGNYIANCSFFNAAGPNCSRCHLGYHINTSATKCCELGEYEDSSNVCKEINHKYCSKAIPDGECSECFLTTSKCVSESEIFVDLVDIQDSVMTMNFNRIKFRDAILSDVSKIEDRFKFYEGEMYLNTSKYCCPKGWYYNTNDMECLKINVDHCLKQNSNATTPTCDVCDYGYKISASKCIKITDCSTATLVDYRTTVAYYSSNGHCCPKGTYFDTVGQKCVPIYDPFCDEATEYGKCSKCRDQYQIANASGSERITSPIVQIKIFGKTTRKCSGFEKTHYYQACLPTNMFASAGQYSYDKLIAKMEYCAQFDYTTLKCTKCLTNANFTNQTDGKCCHQNQILFRGLCKNFDDLPHIQNCIYVDQTTQVCNTCQEGYHKTDGICCPQNYYLNPTTYQCSINFTNCSNFDNYSKKCNQCDFGYYNSYDKCCLHGTIFDSSTQTCVSLQDKNVFYCAEGFKDGSNYTCAKCLDSKLQQDYDGYLYRVDYVKKSNLCTPYTTILNSEMAAAHTAIGNAGAPANTVPSEFYINLQGHPELNFQRLENCEQYGSDYKCTKCGFGFALMTNLTDPMCCPNGSEALVVDSKNKCVHNARKQNCEALDNTLKCTSCSKGYHLTKDFCCKLGEYYDIESSKCQPLYQPELHGCAKKTGGDRYCDECITDYYLSFDEITNERYCCFKGEYWDFAGKQCLKIDNAVNDKITNVLKTCDRVGYNSTSDTYQCLRCTAASNIFKTACAAIGGSSLETSCYVKYDDNNGNEKCKICKDGFYRSSPESAECCAYNQYWKQSGTTCDNVTSVHDNFKEVYIDDAGGLVRGVCQDTYFMKGTACSVLTPATGLTPFCRLQETNCFYAEDGYILAGTAALAINSVVLDQMNYNKCSADSTGLCLGCSVNYYLNTQYGKCCSDQYYWNNDEGECQPLNQYLQSIQYCLNVSYDSQNQKYNCIECDSSQDYYLTQGICCKFNQYKDATLGVCLPASSLVASLQNCNFFTDPTTCRSRDSVSSTLGYDSSDTDCTTSQYLVNGRCCAEGQHYVSGNTCVAIDTGFNCKKYIDSKCTKCTDNTFYLTNDKCCPFGQYYDGSCQAIATDTDCKEMNLNAPLNQQQCDRCENKNVSSEYPQCCEGKYMASGGTSCAALPGNCESVKNDGTCLQCEKDYYLSNSKCCKLGEFNDGGTCKAIATEKNCQQIAQTDCSSCLFDNDNQMTSYNGKCCKKDYIYFSSHPLNECFPKILYDNCSSYDVNTNKCVKCKTGYNLTQDVCCPSGQFLNKVNGAWHCQAVYMQNCKQQFSYQQCSECDSDYQIVENGDVKICCPIGHYFDDFKCSEQPKIQNCIQFTGDVCTKCNTGFYARKDKDNNSKCCSNKSDVLVNVKGESVCMDFNLITSNCSQIDHVKFVCQKCAGNFSIGTDEPICCANGKHFDFNKKTCVDNFLPYCKSQNNNNCQECDSTQQAGPKYLMEGGCCSYDYYYDTNDYKCKKHEKYNCKEYKMDLDANNSAIKNKYLQCKTCNTGYYLVNSFCCKEFEVWNKMNQKCERMIDSCKFYENNINQNFKCSTCEKGYTLNLEKNNCCQDFSFYNSLSTVERCLNNKLLQNVYENCVDWNSSTLLCNKCLDSHYLSEHDGFIKCCPFGEQLNKATKNCEAINLTTYANCNEIKIVQANKCTGCVNNYLANNAGACVEVGQCIDFNANTGNCSKCKKGFYITQNKCCQQEYYFDTSCVNTTPITGCLEYKMDDNTKCAKCKAQYYMLSDKCVNKGMFYNGAAEVEGQVKNCERYSTISACSQCFPHHSLQKIQPKKTDFDFLQTLSKAIYDGYFATAASVDYCFPDYFDNCKKSTFSIATDNNQLTCDTCEQNYFTSTDTPQADKFIKNNVLQENCKYSLVAKTYEKSTYQCTVCNDNYYLNRVTDTCVQRDATFADNCDRLDLYSDECVECSFKYEISSTTKKCIVSPLPNCDASRLEDLTKCAVCKDDEAYTYVNTLTYPDYQCDPHTNWTTENDIADPPLWSKGKITYCDEHHQCKNEFLSNVDLNIQKYLSCHICNESTRIPFISLAINSTGQVLSVKQYSMWQQSTEIMSKYIKGKENKTSECFKTDFSDFILKSGQTSGLFPTKCAIGVFNSSLQIDMEHSKYTSSMGGFDYSKANPICGECKPGYKPTRYSFMNMVTDCAEITNCKSGENGKSFSSCDECDDGFYFKYDISNPMNGGVDRTECYKSTDNHDQFCFAFNTVSKKCHICKQGYSKNHDQICEKLKTDHCEGEGNFPQKFLSSEYNLTYYRKSIGCTKCPYGYQKILQMEDNVICLASTYTIPTTNTEYTTNCEYFQNYLGSTNEMKCYKCKSGYIITPEKQCIILQTAHNNCTIAKDTTKCAQCAQSYVLVDDLCQIENLKNCKTFIQGTSLKQYCEQCNDQYMRVSDGSCTLGTLTFCRQYDYQQQCRVCQSGYYLTHLENDVQYCMPLHGYNNLCPFEENAFFNADFRNAQLNCKTCAKDAILEQISEKQVCVQFNLVETCAEYHIGDNFSNSTLKCTKCREDHYLDNNLCKLRVNIIDRCSQYEVNSDKCKICDDIHILQPGQLSCKREPQGVTFCQIYLDDTQCIKCRPGYYLKSNVCYQVETENQVEFCEDYDEFQKCTQCLSAYFLENGKCQQKNVQFCSVFETANSCKTCEKQYGIKTDTEENNICVLLPEITGCLLQSQVEPYHCLKCNSSTYPSGTPTICNEIQQANKIEKCIEYNDQQLCLQCDFGYYLNSDQKQCIELLSQTYCNHLMETVENQCVLCSEGFEFSSTGECIVNTANSINGCLITDFQNSQRCTMCQFGYSMNTDFICVPNVTDNGKEKPIDDIDNNGKGNGNGNGKNVNVFKVVLRTIMILFFVLNQ